MATENKSLQGARRALGKYITTPIVKLLAYTHVSPNTITWLGTLVACGAGVLAATGHLFAAGWVMAFSGVFDLLDGALARYTNKTTRFGGILDSTLDRISDVAAPGGLIALYVIQSSLAGGILAILAIVGSQLVSYIRARAEAMNIPCEVGIFTRPERVVILSLGLLFSHFNPVLLIALGLIAALSWVTAGQRLFFVWQKTKN
ncbi:MAG TPA: CDP-alcohol phosphatidyltransferase family protein [Dehalococcoidales bacterium]|nr:CDP-alcohol phosphatidyltransferase family protein [Dehalococcoidales bacterium]